MTEALKSLRDAPLKQLYVQATGTWNEFDGAAGKLEAGSHLSPSSTVYVAGTYDRNGPGAEVGYRWEWGW